ncbi:MAG TPA: hypothetical protein VFZ43_01140 [Anaerolineales bacterium]
MKTLSIFLALLNSLSAFSVIVIGVLTWLASMQTLKPGLSHWVAFFLLPSARRPSYGRCIWR